MKKKYEFIDKLSLKVVVVGDTGTGKSSMVSRLSSKPFQEDYKPTMFDNFAATILVDGNPYHLSLFDTAGKEDFNKLRVLSYLNSDVFVICFSVTNPDSLKNVLEYWVPEIRHYIPYVPFVLVGTQIDLRKDDMEKQVVRSSFVSPKQGMDLANKIGACSYLECSALTDEGLEELKSDIISASQAHKERRCSQQTTCCSCEIV